MSRLLHYPWSVGTVWLAALVVIGIMLWLSDRAARRSIAAQEQAEQESRDRHAEALRRIRGGARVTGHRFEIGDGE